MSRRTRVWQILLGANLLLGCNKPSEVSETGPLKDVQCSTKTQCPFGYECEYDAGMDPSNPQSVGECVYIECKLTNDCEKKPKECSLPQETAMCDKFDKDKYCECVRPSSQDVPSTPTTGTTPASGDKP